MQITASDHLITDRLVLRPWTLGDIEPFTRMSSDPEVMAHLRPLASQEALAAWIIRQQVHLKQHGFCFWAVQRLSDSVFLGAAGLLRVG